ncbi:NAD(P)-binding domain-containing protein [Priestia megaterium]|uniref:3-hydroxyisobutyrate dehydrogenase n=2 Tax=Priestia megaterium TaxID=1404 RepID=A0A2B3V285_PRIMG|nr:NAD(P)-binding domain-containing protein [Priestia megaterium]MDH3169453.1 NAD(P)-binding domain-containing protein [Priestia megaterium]MDP1442307.1 NAD(P)-binding domain-containing protein [Priestia megaterium]MDP1471325.1 NAD(P)-binding domain-containing protein [Priestia megaterium]MED3855562.1 NAD(P)-binding domain-containing protein [Priestia megaterium]MED4286923.1 NAD(P)-binding domain-containing protein [Priestia megaterium]
MRFGIIGAGSIGSIISKKLVKNGHDVKIADARGIEHLEGKELTGTPVRIEDAIKNIEILIISLPTKAMPSIRNIIDQVGEEVIIVDTSNYYPFRDDEIEEIENGMVESVWVSNQLGRSVIKAFNNLLAYTLENEGTSEDSSGRIAMAVSGNDPSQKQVVMDVVYELGFDAVDSGSLSDSWRQQPGTPAYCTELTKDELMKALKKANKEKAPLLRDKVMERFAEEKEVEFSHKDVVNLNREIYNS